MSVEVLRQALGELERLLPEHDLGLPLYVDPAPAHRAPALVGAAPAPVPANPRLPRAESALKLGQIVGAAAAVVKTTVVVVVVEGVEGVAGCGGFAAAEAGVLLLTVVAPPALAAVAGLGVGHPAVHRLRVRRHLVYSIQADDYNCSALPDFQACTDSFGTK